MQSSTNNAPVIPITRRPMRRSTLSIALLLLAPLARADQPKPAPPATQSVPATQPKAATQPASTKDAYKKITQKEIDGITFDDIEDDAGFITPLASDLDNLDDDSKKRLDEWVAKLNDWPGSKEEDIGQRVRNLLHIASLADMVHSEFEGETAFVIFDKLKSEIDKDVLIKACAWIILKPNDGKAVTKAPELGWDDDAEEDALRERAQMYAKKLLGRLEGKLPKKE
jgi:hypothetical protein